MSINTTFQEAGEVLAAVSYFMGLDQRTFETIVRSASPHNYDPDQLVILEGEPASVTALEATRLWIINRNTMLGLLDTNPRKSRLIIRDLADRLTHLISLVEDLSLRTVEARLARLLLEQSVGETSTRLES